jgi:dTDP-glucose 4,6-dehydratase
MLLRSLSARGVDVVSLRGSSLRELCLPEVETAVVLAGQTDVDEALDHPVRAFEPNVQIAIDAGEWLRTNRQVRLIYLSSDEVLGEASVPLSERAPHRPTQPYAASKAAAETVLHCFRDTFALDVVTLRACNLVGGNQRARKLIPTAVWHLAQDREVPVHGSGACVREWLAVEDLCDAIALVVQHKLPTGIYHCSSGVRLTVLEVIELVARALGTKARWRHVADRMVNDRTYAMDASRLRSYGWAPRRETVGAIAAAAMAMAGSLKTGETLLGVGRTAEVS